MYPKEYLELLLGTVSANIINVEMFVCIPQRATNDTVEYNEKMAQAIDVEVRKSGLEVVGTIHSHPNCMDCSMSEVDVTSAIKVEEKVSGVLAVYKTETGALRSRVRFWLPNAPLEITLT